jgi:hypothetical protein
MTFLPQAAMDRGLAEELNLRSLIGVVNGCRRVRKPDMVHNTLQPLIEVDAQTYQVRADGELLVCEPASELPLAQRYFCSEGAPMIVLTRRISDPGTLAVSGTVTLDVDSRIRAACG